MLRTDDPVARRAAPGDGMQRHKTAPERPPARLELAFALYEHLRAREPSTNANKATTCDGLLQLAWDGAGIVSCGDQAARWPNCRSRQPLAGPRQASCA